MKSIKGMALFKKLVIFSLVVALVTARPEEAEEEENDKTDQIVGQIPLVSHVYSSGKQGAKKLSDSIPGGDNYNGAMGGKASAGAGGASASNDESSAGVFGRK